MLLTEREIQFAERFAIIPDVQERLTAVITHRTTLDPLADAERTDAALVPGCVSRVWLTGEIDAGGVFRARLDADSALVRGLASALAEICDGAPADEVRTFAPTLWDRLGINQTLSPTRLHGLAQVAARLRALAAR